MRALIQRVTQASVEIDGRVHAQIGHGLLVLMGVDSLDVSVDSKWIIQKIIQLRILNDMEGKMNKSIVDVTGELLVVSQFTLHASTKKGNRPSFTQAARPDVAIPIYNDFLEECAAVIPTKSGVFGADMQVSLVNDGPVTIWLDSKSKE